MGNGGETMNIPEGAAQGITSYKFVDGQWRSLSLNVPKETALSIFINGQELVTILCTPLKLNCLVLGYLTA